MSADPGIGVDDGFKEGVGGGKSMTSNRSARRAIFPLNMALHASPSRLLVQCAPPEHLGDEHLKTRSRFTVESVPHSLQARVEYDSAPTIRMQPVFRHSLSNIVTKFARACMK